MSATIKLDASVRTDKGKGASRRLRRLADQVPAIVYGAGQDPVSLTLEHRHIVKALESEAFYSQILQLAIEGKKEKVVLKALQRHPSKAQILHMDFLRVSAKEKLTMLVPLHFLGEEDAPGVKTGGGIISHQMTSIEVHCLPADLPEFIEVDISELELDQVVHISDLKAPKGVEFTALTGETVNDQPVSSIHIPRAVVEEEEVEEGEGAEEGEEAAGENGDKAEGDSEDKSSE